jgi:UDP-glucose 4-epimerase
MTILVTGGAGYIGSHTVRQLQRAGHEVMVFDSLELGHPKSLSDFELDKNLFQGNLLDNRSLKKVFSSKPIDAVMHFAAYALVGESVKLPSKYLSNNTAGTINLLHHMSQANVNRLIFSSTCAIYGEPKIVPIIEDTPKNPTNPYGKSKLLSEEAIAEMTHYTRLKAAALRYFNACGADDEGDIGEDHAEETHLIPLVLQVALGKRDKIKIFGTDYPTPDGTAVRDYIHVTDLAEAHVAALNNLDSARESFNAYNIGTGTGYSVKAIIEACRQITGHDIPEEEANRRPGDPPELVANARKIKRELGWTPKHSNIQTIISSAWRWHQSHPNGFRE